MAVPFSGWLSCDGNYGIRRVAYAHGQSRRDGGIPTRKPAFPGFLGSIGHLQGNAAVKKADFKVMGFLLRTL